MLVTILENLILNFLLAFLILIHYQKIRYMQVNYLKAVGVTLLSCIVYTPLFGILQMLFLSLNSFLNSNSAIYYFFANVSNIVVFADSGYCSEKNLLYLKEKGIQSYIKLQDHEQRKTRAYKEDIGKYYNMTYALFEDEHYYICHDGRKLRHIRTESKEQDGYTQTVEVYGCADCSGCGHKSKCLYRYNAEKNPARNKVMKINERWEELKEESNTNIQSKEGILKRQIRSIQTEGHFGDIKENENFRRFNYRSAEKVYKEFMLYAIGRNLLKYHRFLHHEIEKYEGKKEQKAA